MDEEPPHLSSQLKWHDLFLTSQCEGASCWFLLSSTGHANVLETEVGSSKLRIALIAIASAILSNYHCQELLRAKCKDHQSYSATKQSFSPSNPL